MDRLNQEASHSACFYAKMFTRGKKIEAALEMSTELEMHAQNTKQRHFREYFFLANNATSGDESNSVRLWIYFMNIAKQENMTREKDKKIK